MSKRRTPFTRQQRPGRLVPTEATTRVLLGIQAHEGVLSQRQIRRRFFPDCTSTWPESRLLHYYDHRLVNKFDASFVNGEQLGEIVYTLDTTGARYLSHELGIRYKALRWRRQPRWLTLAHDLKLNDFRIAVTLAAKASPHFALVKWISEFELLQMEKKGRKMPGRPDGFMFLRRPSPTLHGKKEELALLVEIDNANHPLGRFVKRKVKPLLKFIGSPAYEQTFGVRYGACFVITTGQRRLDNLKAGTEEAGGNGRFYFTTFDQVQQGSVLHKPIWHMAGSQDAFAISGLPLEPHLHPSLQYTPQGQLVLPSVAI